jgi:hypothetical protein
MDRQQREQGALRAPEKGGGTRSSPSELSVNKIYKSSLLANPSTGEGRRGSSPCELSENKV